MARNLTANTTTGLPDARARERLAQAAERQGQQSIADWVRSADFGEYDAIRVSIVLDVLATQPAPDAADGLGDASVEAAYRAGWSQALVDETMRGSVEAGWQAWDHYRQYLLATDATDGTTGGGEEWPLRARVWTRTSVEPPVKVLEIEGVIDDMHMNCRHTQSLSVADRDVPGLPEMYATTTDADLLEQAARVVDDYETYTGDPRDDAVRDCMAVDLAARIRVLSARNLTEGGEK